MEDPFLILFVVVCFLVMISTVFFEEYHLYKRKRDYAIARGTTYSLFEKKRFTVTIEVTGEGSGPKPWTWNVAISHPEEETKFLQGHGPSEQGAMEVAKRAVNRHIDDTIDRFKSPSKITYTL